jgi:hypothetical protein
MYVRLLTGDRYGTLPHHFEGEVNMCPETVLHAVLKALARLETTAPVSTGFGFDGYTEGEIGSALEELQRGGYIDGHALTEKGRRLLEDLSK